jgi:hypothetical protein
MTNRENPAMKAVEAPRLDAAGQALTANPRSRQLLTRDHAMLTSGQARNQGVRVSVGNFLTHVRE